jgi:hypothetical protein
MEYASNGKFQQWKYKQWKKTSTLRKVKFGAKYRKINRLKWKILRRDIEKWAENQKKKNERVHEIKLRLKYIVRENLTFLKVLVFFHCLYFHC